MPIFKRKDKTQSNGEVRQSVTDQVVTEILRRNADATQSGVTAAAEIICGVITRAFSAAQVSGLSSMFTAEILGQIGSAIALTGESVWLISGTEVFQASTVTVKGGYRPKEWRYDLTLPAPSESYLKRSIPASDVLHFVFDKNKKRPWQGVAPITRMELTVDLDATLQAVALKRLNGPFGGFLPIPATDGAADNVEQLRSDIGASKGNILMVESQAGQWQQGAATPGTDNWNVKEFGGNLPQNYAHMSELVTAYILGAYGIPASLYLAKDATSAREGWRQVLFGLLTPLGLRMAAEIRTKLGIDVTFNWDALRASDVQARASAYKSLRDGEMPDADARRYAGFEV